ncbi:RNA polymerase sigma factor [Paenibacillus elgii]|uniref:RNA polymerase sigma factor n=1 Tax=Paenibacillus elgii TaxID=189691 RepID=UPI00203AA73F|nr:RNA polymerase sigma factor [Paenibacillus elgii]MCM3268915.1 RNA polymerase sigma factor [Paenibacillus elgii]
MKEYLISEEQSRAWFEEHSPYVYGIALMMTKSAMLADDITQETFLRAYRILKSESEHELWQVVNRLSPKRREVLVLVYYVGLSLQETASLLNIRLGTCKSRLHAALEQLRNDDAESYQLTSIKEGLK